MNKIGEGLERAIAFLDAAADRLDGWAKASLAGGWSTHQVDANRKVADDCRREAAGLRSLLATLKPESSRT